MALAAPQGYVSDIAAESPDRGIVLLYDDAVAALRKATAAIASDDVEARCRAVCAATEVITTLYLHLDIGRCAELADDLAQLYSRILDRLVEINLHNDSGTAQAIIELLDALRDSRTNPKDTISAAALPAPPRRAVNGASAAPPANAVPAGSPAGARRLR